MTYTAVTLMLLGDVRSSPQNHDSWSEWTYMENTLQRFASYRPISSTDQAGMPSLPPWSESCFTDSVVHIARLATRKTSDRTNSAELHSKPERLKVLELMEQILDNIKSRIDEAEFRSDASIRAKLGLVWGLDALMAFCLGICFTSVSRLGRASL